MARRVLIVDDSLTTADQLKRIVEGLNGYTVVGHAKDGIEALALYRSLQPDIVCMDLIMPRMDGLQATRAIVQLDPQARVAVISSMGGVQDKVNEALRMGARTVITKPFHPEQIRQVLESL